MVAEIFDAAAWRAVDHDALRAEGSSTRFSSLRRGPSHFCGQYLAKKSAFLRGLWRALRGSQAHFALFRARS